jgi:hypothetical protein
MSKQTRLSSTNRVKLTLFFNTMAADIANHTIESLHKLAKAELQCEVAESSIYEILKVMGVQCLSLIHI